MLAVADAAMDEVAGCTSAMSPASPIDWASVTEGETVPLNETLVRSALRRRGIGRRWTLQRPKHPLFRCGGAPGKPPIFPEHMQRDGARRKTVPTSPG
jgi:hypothetical protein